MYNFNYIKDIEDNEFIDDLSIDTDTNIVKDINDIDNLVDISLTDLIDLIDDNLELREVNNKVFKKFVSKYGKKKAKVIYYATANKQGRDPETWEFATKKENTSASVAGYNTPNAFIDVTEDELEDEFNYNKYYGKRVPEIDSKLKADNKFKKLKTEDIEVNTKVNEFNIMLSKITESYNELDMLVKKAVKFKFDNEFGQEQIKRVELNNLLELKLNRLNMLLTNLSD